MGELEIQTITALDGAAFKDLIAASLSWLRRHQDAVNALNVFPVPDGDTGTNMTLTMNSAWDEITDIEDVHIGNLASKVAHGALMGARGNSGVILSQIWRGLAYGLDGNAIARTEHMAVAMRSAADTAYKGVVKPVEGTILTVAREIAEEAVVAAGDTQDFILFFERIVSRAERSVARTPSMLPVLKQAGVVDAGGQGLYMIYMGMLRKLKGLPVSSSDESLALETVAEIDMHEMTGVVEFDKAYPYDVQFLIIGDNLPVADIRAHIESLGDCPLTVGDEKTIKIHVHVADPGLPISYGVKWGSVRDVVVEDMKAQYEAFTLDKVSEACETVRVFAALVNEEPPNISVVVISAGEGLGNVFTSLGASAVVQGGQTMNPSTQDILNAVEMSPSNAVIILPNNKNIWMAAEQAAEVSTKNVVVVPTRTIPQGICAILALDQGATLDSNALAMSRVAREVITGEITWATRTVAINGIDVNEGDAIGLLDDELVVDAQSFDEAVLWLMAAADLDERELVTIYFGSDSDFDQAEQLSSQLAEKYPDLEFEVIDGGQPHYPYIVSIE
ncbi:MAG: DAK2 domain-containing protein [Anaerolineae bacterium]|nr:DAK2 domain-containing protein [Anaerolineae bacterium]